MKTISKKEYSRLVKKHSQNSPVFTDTLKAFVVGGIICTIGQAFRNFYFSKGLDTNLTGTATCISLILIAAILTALNIFDKIAKFAGAGTLVPITGFANAVVSPCMEFKTEGLVLGTASRMFVVAGPVIAYGTISSIIAGLIYYFLGA
jgi:stage V sporulation protein AC